MGGLPDRLDLIKHSITTYIDDRYKDGCTTAKVSNEYNFEDNDDDDDIAEDKDKVATHYQQVVPQH